MNEQVIERENLPQIYHLGHFVEDRVHAFNSYLIQADGVNVIIDVPPSIYYNDWKSTVNSRIQIHQITHLFIQTMTMSNTTFFLKLYEDGFVGQIVTTAFLASQLLHVKADLDVVQLDKAPMKVTLFNKLVVHCYPLDFLPFPKMFMTYIPSINTLFSATLFASFFEGKKTVTWGELEPLMNEYHHYYIPSSEFVRAPMKVIDRLKIKRIFPAMGYLIPGLLIGDVLKWGHDATFTNAQSVYIYDEQGSKSVQYSDAIDQMIAYLIKQFKKDDVLQVLKSAPFPVDFNGHALIPHTMNGEEAWHLFFNHLHARKGDLWIMFLRPFVKRFEEDGLPKPMVYEARETQMGLELEKSQQEKALLEQQIVQLKQQVEMVKEMQLRCPITLLYYVDEFKKKL